MHTRGGLAPVGAQEPIPHQIDMPKQASLGLPFGVNSRSLLIIDSVENCQICIYVCRPNNELMSNHCRNQVEFVSNECRSGVKTNAASACAEVRDYAVQVTGKTNNL